MSALASNVPAFPSPKHTATLWPFFRCSLASRNTWRAQPSAYPKLSTKWSMFNAVDDSLDVQCTPGSRKASAMVRLRQAGPVLLCFILI